MNWKEEATYVWAPYMKGYQKRMNWKNCKVCVKPCLEDLVSEKNELKVTAGSVKRRENEVMYQKRMNWKQQHP